MSLGLGTLNTWWTIGAIGSNLTLRLGQWFMSKGISYTVIIGIDLACSQPLPNDLLWSPPWVNKMFQFSGKVSQNLGEIPALGKSHWSAVQLKFRGNAKDLSSVESLSALKSNLERHPSSRVEFCPSTRMSDRENSKAAPLVCHRYGMRGFFVVRLHTLKKVYMRFLVASSFFTESWKSHLLLMHSGTIRVPSSCACSLCHGSFVGF